MVSWLQKNNKATFIVLFVIILAGTLVRLPGLTEFSMTHIEMYVPGIDLTPELSIPGPRFTVMQIFRSMMEEIEPHPPGYYLFMFMWTRLLNTDIFTIRFPSLFFGVGCILLIFALGYLESSKKAALWAAGMLALNGYHILWSQLAKMYMMGCFLGLLSSVLLTILIKDRVASRGWLIGFLYVITTLSGLATTVWFWPIFITQIIWVLIWTWRKQNIPGLLRLQVLILILASPLISLAIFQSRRPSYASEEGGIWLGMGQFLQMGFLFLKEYLPGPVKWFHILATILLAPLTVFLLILGLKSDSTENQKSDSASSIKGPSLLYLLIAVILSIFIILKFSKFSIVYNAEFTRLVIISITIPIFIFLVAILFDKRWQFIQTMIFTLNKKVSLSCAYRSISAFLALIPVLIIVLISPFLYLFSSRGILLYVPYLILLMSKGLMELASRTKYWWVIATILLVIYPMSIIYIRYSYRESETNFKALAEAWIPKIEDTDLIFLRRHPLATPILYYLKPDDYNFVVKDFSEEVTRHPNSRIWVLSGTYIPAPGRADEALEGYQQSESILTRWIEADLYVRQ